MEYVFCTGQGLVFCPGNFNGDVFATSFQSSWRRVSGSSYLKGQKYPVEEALMQTWEEEFADVVEHAAHAMASFFVGLVHAEFKIGSKVGDETEVFGSNTMTDHI